MTTASVPITNFTAGEWSPLLAGRSDLQRYSGACSELVNMALMPQGPVRRRMGTFFVERAAAPSARLIPFAYNTAQNYVLEFTPGLLRFFRSGGYLSGLDIVTPYEEADVAALAFCQAADVMYLVCPHVAPRKLSRSGPDEFTLAPVEFVGAPAEWADGNYPSVAAFFQQRLWMAGHPLHVNKIWASGTGRFQKFGEGPGEENYNAAADDSPLTVSLAAEQANAVRWMLARHMLTVGTSGGEWVLSGERRYASEAALTPSNLGARLNSNYGSSPVRPLVAGAAAAYVSEDARRLMCLAYEFGQDAWVSQDLSLFAGHLTRAGIRATAYAQNPDGIIWCVLRDGAMAGCTWMKDQEVLGWHRFETGGLVRDVCCIPADDGAYTETWLVVERQNGVFIERVAAPWDGDSTNDPACFYVDSGLAYDEAAPQTHFSGLDHLEGQEINILADGAEHPRRIVSNGGFTLDVPASVVCAGLPYAWRVAPMRLEGFSPRGTAQGKKTLISQLTARVYKTAALNWTRPLPDGSATQIWPVSFRQGAGKMDQAPAPFTGDLRLAMPGGWHEDSRARLSHDGALPATIVFLAIDASVNE